MDIVLSTWNGSSLTTYKAVIAEDSPLFGNATFGEIQRSGKWPVKSGKTFSGNSMIIELFCPVGTTIGAFRNAMYKLFDPERDFEYPLVGLDASDIVVPNRPWYLNGESLGLVDPTASSIRAVLHVSDPVWKEQTPEVNTISLTASGQTKSITVLGSALAYPQYTLKPTSSRTGSWGYKRYIAICNVTDAVYNDAINITNGNLNTSTLVGAGKMLASGDDCRVTLNAAYIYRWAGGGGFNSATTRFFCNLSLPKQIVLTLSGTLSNIGAIATISVKQTPQNLLSLKNLAIQKNKVIAISLTTGSEEIFTYTGVSLTNYTITGTVRAQRLSSNKSQVDGASIRHIPYDIYMIYGNSGAAPFVNNDIFKPMFDIANTTNASRVYADYRSTTEPNRLGQFVATPVKNVGGLSGLYTANHNTIANPASEMGLRVQAYKIGTVVYAPDAQMQWTLSHPAGFTSITLSGEKYRKNAGTGWPAVVTLRKSNDGTTWTDVVSEVSPVAANTWEATTGITGAQTLSGTYKNVGLFMQGTVAKIDATYAAIEFDGVTCAVDTSLIPLISFGAENVNEYNEFRIENTTTNQWLDLAVPAALNQTIMVDTKNLNAYNVDTGEAFPVKLDDESRADWLALDPTLGGGANVIKITQTGLVACDFGETHEARAG